MITYMEDNLDMPLSNVLHLIQDRIMTKTTYHGIPTQKSPVDFWIYQEIISETRPDVIIEIGNNYGGSTLALAHICDLLDNGRVIGLDMSHAKVPEHVRNHNRITLIKGDACRSFEKVTKLISEDESVLVIEDSAHTYENTLKVLETYSGLVTPGNYFIVEDSICHHGLATGPNPGPYESIESFVNSNPHFESDRSRESFLITWNPKGYLKRINYADDTLSTKKLKLSPDKIKTLKSSMKDILISLIPPFLLQIIKKIRHLW